MAPARRGGRPAGRFHGQFFLDLGQSDFSSTTCKVCRLVYAPGLSEDEKVHAAFHRRHLEGVSFRGWQSERVVKELSKGGGARIVMVLQDDPPHHVRKIAEVASLVERELGLPEGWLMSRPSKSYMAISRAKKVIGLVMAEPIQEAFPVVIQKERWRTPTAPASPLQGHPCSARGSLTQRSDRPVALEEASSHSCPPDSHPGAGSTRLPRHEQSTNCGKGTAAERPGQTGGGSFDPADRGAAAAPAEHFPTCRTPESSAPQAAPAAGWTSSGPFSASPPLGQSAAASRRDGAAAGALQFGGCVLKRDLWQRRGAQSPSVGSPGGDREDIVLRSAHAAPAVCGVRALWVHCQHRREGVATELLNAVRWHTGLLQSAD